MPDEPSPIRITQSEWELLSKEQRRGLGRRSGRKRKIIIIKRMKTTREDGKWDFRVTYYEAFRPGMTRNKWKRFRARLKRHGILTVEQVDFKKLEAAGIQP